ncbi:hypothetical protein CRUP_015982, partial [Coryphaenoides rupestris]
AGLEEASESPGYTQQDSQSDCELVIVPDGKLHDTQAFSLSLSVESLGLSRPQSQSQDYLCASEPPDKRGGGGGGRGGGRGRSGSGGGGDDKMEAAAEAMRTEFCVIDRDGDTPRVAAVVLAAKEPRHTATRRGEACQASGEESGTQGSSSITTTTTITCRPPHPPGDRQTDRLGMDALKSAGRAIIKSPGAPRHTWGTSKHERHVTAR